MWRFRSISALFGLLSFATASPGAESIDDIMARLRNEHFLECARAFDEKPLDVLARDRSLEVYRVFYMPSFHPQVSMRVNVWPSGTGRMTLRRIPPYCSNRNPQIEERAYGLSTAEVARVRETFARSDFWNWPLGRSEAKGEEGVVCSDGAAFDMEALKDGTYNRVSRGCVWPHQLDEILVLFHELAKIKDPHRTE